MRFHHWPDGSVHYGYLPELEWWGNLYILKFIGPLRLPPGINASSDRDGHQKNANTNSRNRQTRADNALGIAADGGSPTNHNCNQPRAATQKYSCQGHNQADSFFVLHFVHPFVV